LPLPQAETAAAAAMPPPKVFKNWRRLIVTSLAIVFNFGQIYSFISTHNNDNFFVVDFFRKNVAKISSFAAKEQQWPLKSADGRRFDKFFNALKNF
jgi:hypothetical protein